MPSSVIRQISYDRKSRTLFVRFIDGDLYAYLGVDPQVHAEMERAASKGRFFARRVRGRFRFHKMPEGV